MVATDHISIRAVTGPDRDLAVRLLTAQLVEHALPADPGGIGRGIDLALEPGSPAWLLLAERSGEAVGITLANQIVSVEKYGFALWIEELYVLPTARRTGVARALLAFLVEEGRKRGVRAIELEVVPSQSAAFALYRGIGFREVHRQRLSFDV
jgi:ribosomal protein S18 acetylase RimI-like enzyme